MFDGNGIARRRITIGVIAALVTVTGCSGGDDESSPVTEVSATEPSAVTSAAPSTTAPPPATTAAPATTVPPPTTVAPTTTPPPPPTTAAPATTVPETTEVVDTTVPPTTAPAGVSYPVQPDGSPVPILGIYNDDRITLTGVVPSEAARERLEVLALANSKVADAKVINEVTIDPTMPGNVGVRVLEMQSVRFPENSADIKADHALELDRAIGIMEAIPNATVLVIGHSDQRGSDEANFKISDERAQAVANHLVAGGISPLRVSSRAAGELDLLTGADDEAALALNRRTEFIFYGLLLA